MKCPKCGGEVNSDYSNYLKPFYYCDNCMIPFTDWQQEAIQKLDSDCQYQTKLLQKAVDKVTAQQQRIEELEKELTQSTKHVMLDAVEKFKLNERITLLEQLLREIEELPHRKEDWFGEQQKIYALDYAVGRMNGQADAAAIAQRAFEEGV
jgi:hypothetical protein